MERIKGFKGFDKDLKCRDKQYAIGKEEVEDVAQLCNTGLHFCENPHDIFDYYAAGNDNRFCEVEAAEVSDERENNSKRVAKRLFVKTEISVFHICKIAVSTFFESFGFKSKIDSADTNNAGDYGAANAGDCGAANADYKGAANAGNYGAANAGDYGAANAGDCGAANAGYKGAANAGNYGAANADYKGAANAGNRGAANAGNYGAANAGNYGAANAGYKGAANAGDYGAANAGNRGAANAGNYGAANAGNYGAANAGNRGAANAGNYGAANAGNYGAASVKENGVAISSTGGKVKGGKGSVLVLVNRDDDYNVIDSAMAIVDGTTILPDTWYKLDNGKFLLANEPEGTETKQD